MHRRRNELLVGRRRRSGGSSSRPGWAGKNCQADDLARPASATSSSVGQRSACCSGDRPAHSAGVLLGEPGAAGSPRLPPTGRRRRPSSRRSRHPASAGARPRRSREGVARRRSSRHFVRRCRRWRPSGRRTGGQHQGGRRATSSRVHVVEVPTARRPARCAGAVPRRRRSGRRAETPGRCSTHRPRIGSFTARPTGVLLGGCRLSSAPREPTSATSSRDAVG